MKSILKNIKLTKGMYKNMPFVAFLALFAMAYIANAHHGERLMREIQVLERDAKEERWRCMSVEAELTEEGRRSQVQGRVFDDGLSVPVKPPIEIVTSK